MPTISKKTYHAMKYFLSYGQFINQNELEIDSFFYDELSKARVVLLNAFALEQKYEILIENYLAFEKEILARTMEFLVKRPASYDTHYEDISLFNVRLINLLTSAKLYIDQSSQNIRKCIGEDSLESINPEKEFSNEYDNSKEYRFMCALRDYVQHRGLPIHIVSKGLHKDSSKKNRCFEYHMELFCRLVDLKNDKKFKKKILTEQEDKIDLKIAVRQYVESISRVHNHFRIAISGSTHNSRSIIENAHADYKEKVRCKTDYLEAYKKSGSEKSGVIPLLLDWDDIRIQLQKKNKELKNLRKRYVTSLSQKNERSNPEQDNP